MNADDIFGILLVFVSVLGALFFMVSLIKKKTVFEKEKSQFKQNLKSKI